MFRRASALVTGALAGVVLVFALAGAALADAPADSATPTPAPTSTPTAPPGLVRGPAPSAVTGIRFEAGSLPDAVSVSWTGDTTARSYTVRVQNPRGAAERTYDTGSALVRLTGVQPRSVIRVGIVAHGDGGDSPPATADWTQPAAVPAVAAAAIAPTAAGLRVTWTPAPGAPSGLRYLVRVQGADGTILVRTVSGRTVGFAGIARDTIYSASVITESPDGRRSIAVDVDGVLVPARSAAQPPLGPPGAPAGPPVAQPSRGGTAPVAPAVQALPTARAPTTSAALIATPAAALGCAVAALVLGGTAIIALLRRRPRRY